MTQRTKIIPILLWVMAQGVFLSACIDEDYTSAIAAPASQQALYVGNEQVTRSGFITRDEYSKLHRISGGVNDDGTYPQPIVLSDVGLSPETLNGWYLMPFEWDPDNGIVLKVQDGLLVQEIFYIPQP